MIKQNLGSVYAIAGETSQIEPLFNSLFNWNGLSTKLHDFGNPESFVYFLIERERYLTARAHCFVCQISTSLDKGKERGNWQIAREMAEKEWNNIPHENFLYTKHQEQDNLEVSIDNSMEFASL